jgi:hypothetical protein
MDDPFERSPNVAQYNQPELFSKGWRIRRSHLEDSTLMKWERIKVSGGELVH